MAMNNTRKFLVGAAEAASAEGYFRPQEVGHALGFTAEESAQAVRTLGERKLIVPLQNGQARLRSAGQALAAQVDRKAEGHVSPSPLGRYRGPRASMNAGAKDR